MDRPGFLPMFVGGLIALFALVLACSPAPDEATPFGWLAYTGLQLAVGVGLLVWGWRQLRRAKVVRPQLTWWQYIGTDAIGAALFVGLFAVFAAIGPERRDAFMTELHYLTESLNIARGGR